MKQIVSGLLILLLQFFPCGQSMAEQRPIVADQSSSSTGQLQPPINTAVTGPAYRMPRETWWAYLFCITLSIVISLMLLLDYARRLQDKARQRHHRRLQLYIEALDELPEGLLIAGIEGKLLFANCATPLILNRSMGEVLGRSIFDLLFEQSVDAKNALQFLNEKGFYRGDISYPFTNEKDITIELSISTVEHNDEDVRYISIVRDVTYRKVIQAGLAE